MNIDEFQSVIDAAESRSDGAGIRGIHSEGPYLNRVGEKGIDNGHPDIRMEDVQKLVEAGNGWLKLVALAYELPHGNEAAAYMASQGIRVSIAHTNATYEQAMEAFHHGVTVTTHTANVMTGIHHRNMGTLGAALLDDGVFNEVICDGLHVRDEMLEIMFRIKNDPWHKFMMISDNIPLAGFPEGRYMYADMAINITREGFALTDTGRLCGSAKPVLYGMKNLVTKMNIPIEKVSMMASLNPCQVYGFGDRKGSIRNGKDADIAVIDDDFNCLYTFVEGNCVFNYRENIDLINQDALEQIKVQLQ
jgi:N-acetylglucosamine-6-phosphate deacetylase